VREVRVDKRLRLGAFARGYRFHGVQDLGVLAWEGEVGREGRGDPARADDAGISGAGGGLTPKTRCMTCREEGACVEPTFQ
jgi:hypothetical protein